MSVARIRAGGADIEIGIKDHVQQGLNRVKARLTAFASGVRVIGTALTGLSGAGLAGLLGAAKVFADTGSGLHDMAARTGVAADNLSELKFAADQTGASIEDVERALRFMAKSGLDPNKFDEVLASIASIEDPAKRVAATLKTFGKTGTQLLPMAKELKLLRAQARALGVVVSPEQAAAADDLGDAFDRLKAAVKGAVVQIGAAMAPALTAILDTITPVVAGISHFIRANPMLVTTLAAVAVGGLALGGVLLGLAGTLTVIGAAVAFIPAAIAGIGVAFAAVTSPVGLLVAALTAATAAMVTLGVVYRRELAGMLTYTAMGLQEAAKMVGMGWLADYARGVRSALGAVTGVAMSKLPKIPKSGMDFGGLEGFGESKFGTSRGQFGGFRAESLAVGSGGGLEAKVDKTNKLLEEIRRAVEDTTDAVEESEGATFS